jgi:hypothetical protein
LKEEYFKIVQIFSLKIDGGLPVFAGVLGSMFVCALIAVYGFGKPAGAQSIPVESEISGEPDISLSAAGISPEYSVRTAFLNPLPKPAGDRILEYYRDPGYRDAVVAFFTTLCGSGNVAAVILSNAAAHDVSPSLAFALCWEESRYNPRAVNRNNRDESVDRGLFQLNNRSFPNIADAGFFDLDTNARYGMSHLRLCLDTGGTEIAALAMYNAGTGRVRSTGAPKITLDYIQRILEGRRKIERIFAAEFSLPEEPFLAKKPPFPEPEGETAGPGKSGLNPALASVKPSRSWLVRLAPLSGNR